MKTPATTGRDQNGVPPVVGKGDGTITGNGTFVPAPLSAADVEKLREVIKTQNPLVDLPDGSIKITLTIPAEIAEPLKAWADGCGEPEADYIANMVLTALNATVLGNMVA